MKNRSEFLEYMLVVSPNKSGKASSYNQAINILDDIFRQKDVFGMGGISLFDVDDVELLWRIREFVKNEEKKKKNGEPSIFDFGKPNQTSYPIKGFCSVAILSLIYFVKYNLDLQGVDEIVRQQPNAKRLSTLLIEHFDLNKEGTDEKTVAKQRHGQSYFRRMVLANYTNQCCVTGLNVPELLRASHIVAWKDDKRNRMNPENGLCLSATYDTAFDQHLISFDEDYRMIVSKSIRDFYTAQATRDYFEAFEGKPITLPTKFLPNQNLLAKHRELLIM